MATLTTQQITRAALSPTYAAAAAGGDAVACGQGCFIHVKNTGGSPITVTLNIPAAVNWEPNVALTSPTVSVPATTGDRMIGPIDDPTFSDPITNLCSVTYSAVT